MENRSASNARVGDDHQSSPSGATQVSHDDVCQQLERILASEGFARAERMSRFLRFIVEQTLLGRGGKLKEYLIGVEVFDRRESFDPRTDPVVRGEARRLRVKLKEYYDTEGQNDLLRVLLPKGSYCPGLTSFQHRRVLEPMPAPVAANPGSTNCSVALSQFGLRHQK